jgi:hypothetical protein
MGNTGVDDQHVHYQLKDPAGHAINPTEFWDRLGLAKTDPGALAYRDQYEHYLLGRGADATNEFGGAVSPVAPTPRTNSPAGNGVTNNLAPFESPRTGASRPVPYLDSTNAAQQLFAKVPPTDFPAFPSWASPGRAISPAIPQPPNGSPALPAPRKQRRSATPDDLAPTSAQGALPATPSSQPYTAGTGGVLGKFFLDSLITPAEAASPAAQGAPLLTPYFPGQASTFGDRSGITPGVASPDTPLRRISSAFPGMALPGPDPAPPPQPGRPLGIFTGRPMPSWITPPPLGGLLNNSNAAGNNDGFNLLAGLVSRNPTQPEPPQQTAGSIPERRLGRSILNQSPAPAYDPGAATAPLASSVDANYSGGPLGMYAALAGTDPQDPNQPASPDDAQEQANIQALEARLSSSGNINDAWALYNARKSSRS